MAPQERGWVGAIMDKYVGWTNGLPRESCSYTMEGVQIPMQDGITLVADLYRPILPPPGKPAGTLLVCGPYGRGMALAMNTARLWAARSYQILMVSSRGTFGSGGVFEPGSHDSTDGRQVVEWMREQDWYTGSFATVGASYLGFTQWSLLSWSDGPPPDMKAAVINTGLHDLADYAWGTGALASVLIFWAAFVGKLFEEGMTPLPLVFWNLQRAMRKVFDSAPLLDAVDTSFQGAAPSWIRDVVTNPTMEGPRGVSMRQNAGLGQADMPILLVTGWQDVIKSQVMEQYTQLSKRGCKVALTIGPWTHLGAGGGNTLKETLAWFGQHLASPRVEDSRSPVRVFIGGAEEWRDMEEWPPATTPKELYLSAGGQLTEEKPLKGAEESSFEFNPASPTPAVGSPTQFGRSPATEDTTLADRADVITFTTKPLESQIEVCGKPVVVLHHETSTPFADLLVRLSEVDANGTSHNVGETYMRLDRKRAPGPVKIIIPDCGHRFAKGKRLRVVIAGGAHPLYIRNFGTGEEAGRETTMVAVQHTIFHHESALSKIILPVSPA